MAGFILMRESKDLTQRHRVAERTGQKLQKQTKETKHEIVVTYINAIFVTFVAYCLFAFAVPRWIYAFVLKGWRQADKVILQTISPGVNE